MHGHRDLSRPRTIAVTGTSGYIGGRLVPRLVEAGHHLRCLARDPEALDDTVVAGASIVRGSIENDEALHDLLAGARDAFYLVHSMRRSGETFHARDCELARRFATTCRAAGVERIIYLGGLGRDDDQLSEHLASRHATGRALTEAGVPVLEFRAAVIVGSGSASFEMLRHLTERLPVMITPRWVDTRCQPIAIRDVLGYFLEAVERPEIDGVVEIGGTEVLSYRDMMTTYARLRGLTRVILPVPVLTPRLSSWWVHLVTPIPAAIARPLIDGLSCEVVVHDDRARRLFDLEPISYSHAVELALDRLRLGEVETTWCSSFASLADRVPEGRRFVVSEGMYIERHREFVPCDPALVFAACCRLGGRNGWPAGEALWRGRALLDALVGGVGMRRGRRDQQGLRLGDPVDFWRVEEIRPDRLLRLRAELRMPGHGWLQFRTEAVEGGCRLTVSAFFEPKGFTGLCYWLATLPLHRFIFPALGRALRVWAMTGGPAASRLMRRAADDNHSASARSSA